MSEMQQRRAPAVAKQKLTWCESIGEPARVKRSTSRCSSFSLSVDWILHGRHAEA
jgi:hypothetical protein